MSQETHNGTDCVRCLDDCCFLALRGTEEKDTARRHGIDIDDDDDEDIKKNKDFSTKAETAREHNPYISYIFKLVVCDIKYILM